MQFDKEKIRSTLGERSKNDEGIGFIESTKEVLDFDEITQEVADRFRNKRPMGSCDALHIKDEGHIYLLEFKNARKSQIGKRFFLQKAYDSALTLAFAFFPNLSLEEIKEKLYLIVVYNDGSVIEQEEKSESFQAIKDEIRRLSGRKESILFGLGVYEGILYKKVLTVNKEVFMEEVYKEIF
ncbi:MAG: hypothetical protein HFH38_10375 [Lachnospiraceae bacterium]|jgi:hypothetical protein|nr:hypothetical protein [Lachnospiraceae bacterium]